jgi:hypothetical protein
MQSSVINMLYWIVGILLQPKHLIFEQEDCVLKKQHAGNTQAYPENFKMLC